MDRKAFCPGHVTGFFEICMSDDVLSTGSRGAGFCLSLGATSRVRMEPSTAQQITALIEGSGSRAEVSIEAIRTLIGTEPLRVEVRTVLDLPMRQGFGMSAAGSLSAAIAAADILGIPRQRAFEAAHTAEVRCGSGLGDVSAIHGGGVAFRKRAGLPPAGEVIRIDGSPELVLVVVGKELMTKAVLEDPGKVSDINASGSRMAGQLASEPTVGKLLELSHQFALETELASERVREAMAVASRSGRASMSMLGNSVFAIGDSACLKRDLARLGKVWTCVVDTEGPRLLPS